MLKQSESIQAFGGWLIRCPHPSTSCQCSMTDQCTCHRRPKRQRSLPSTAVGPDPHRCEFLAEQLYSQDLQAACAEEGYNHSFHFVTMLIGEQLAWYARALQG